MRRPLIETLCWHALANAVYHQQRQYNFTSGMALHQNQFSFVVQNYKQ